jgi:hypothetical protein
VQGICIRSATVFRSSLLSSAQPAQVEALSAVDGKPIPKYNRRF